MKITPDNALLQYSGRIDFDNKLAPVLVFPCSYIKMKFSGTTLRAEIENNHGCWNNYMGCIIDDRQEKILLPEEGRVTISLAENLEDTIHEVIFFKRMDSCHMITFYGFEIADDAKLYPVESLPERRIEVYGDSVSAGEVSEAVAYVGQPDPEHQGEYSNSWYSYAWMTARKLGAQIHDIAQGGIPLLDHTGWFADPLFLGMESVYDKIEYNPELGELKQWDFDLYRPHVVIVALGQNDSHPVDYMDADYNCKEAVNWRTHYKQFILRLRELYPKAQIILATTILEHSKAWDDSIDAVCEELQDEKIHHFLYSLNGCGTKGHIRIPEADKMSDELAAYIESLGDGIWENEE